MRKKTSIEAISFELLEISSFPIMQPNIGRISTGKGGFKKCVKNHEGEILRVFSILNREIENLQERLK